MSRGESSVVDGKDSRREGKRNENEEKETGSNRRNLAIFLDPRLTSPSALAFGIRDRR